MEEDKFSISEENQSISASIIEENLGTRTILSDNPTNRKMEVYWKSDDAIGVFGSSSGSNIRYQTQESAISKDGKSTVFKTTATAAEGDIIAYYPYQQGATATPDGVLHLTMPATQTYYTEHAGIVQPDPTVSIMAGKGEDGKINFRNLFSILRVNVAGSDGQTVKKVLFTDLSGKPVSGNFTVSWNGEVPQAEFPETGSGKDLQIEIDCKDGVALANNSLNKFYLIVPPRNYDKGFQIEFVLDNGEKIIKTIGATAGKILLRSVLYPIGDMFPNQEDKVNYTLDEKASVMSDERLDLITDASLDTASYELTLIVDNGFEPQENEMIIINKSSAALPNGYVGKVRSVSGSTVLLQPVTDITEVFEELSIGGPVWSSGAGAIETGGYAIDLSQYITSIETHDGKPIEFAVDGSAIYMQVPYTRAEAEFDDKFALPALNHTFEIKDKKNPENDCELKLGVQMDLGLYFHILIQRWSLKDLQCRVNPTIKFTSAFGVEWASSTYGTEIPFVVVRSAPIPAGPVMIIPLIEFFLTFDLEGKIGMSAELSYSKEFSVGMAYQSGGMNSYGRIIEEETTKSPWGFKPAVQLEGSFAVGLAPKVGFSLWEIIRLDTRVYTKVKSGASLNLDLSDSDFDPSLYNAISDSKLFSNLEMYMKGGVYGWRNREFAATQSTTLEYPLWEGYFVPKLENFSINASRGEMDIELDISNKLFFDAKIGMNFYERNKHDSQFTELAGSMHLCDYTKPPGKKDTYNLQMKKRINLPSSKEYEARITVEFDAPGGPYTIETDVKTTFIESYIMITTSKARGETISLGISVDQVNWSNVWIDLNNNGVKDEGERVTKFTLGDQYTIQSQTFSIYGIVTSLSCSNNKITSLDISGNTSLTSLYCNDNELTTLDVSDCTELRYLYCSNNQLTSLDVSNDTALVILDCYNTSLTSLDLSGNTAFEYLTCYNTPLTSIDVSGCTKLKTLLCYDSQLTSLDISGCEML